MKKILGTLGVTLIIAVSFFNMSSVVDAKQNVDLASIIQNASADDESGLAIYNLRKEYNTVNVETYWKQIKHPTGSGWIQVSCSRTDEVHVVECLGSGTVTCEPVDEVITGEEDCS